MNVVEVAKFKNGHGKWVYNERPVASRTTHVLSAAQLQRLGGGTLAALQAAKSDETAVGAWTPGLRRLLEEVSELVRK